MAAAVMLKITKIATSPLLFDDHNWSFNRSAPTIKNLNFTTARWRTAAILKAVKSPYLCNQIRPILMRFGMVMHIGPQYVT